jgi:hypothetical protein
MLKIQYQQKIKYKNKMKEQKLENTPVIWELEWMEDYNYRTGWNWEMFSKYEYIQWPDALCTSNCHAEIPIVSFDKYDQKSAIHKYNYFFFLYLANDINIYFFSFWRNSKEWLKLKLFWNYVNSFSSIKIKSSQNLSRAFI